MRDIDIIKAKIVTVYITKDMIEEAEREEEERTEKYGYKTREVMDKTGKVVRRDLIGSLAHQAVEMMFDQYNVPYKSTRTERYGGGDTTDIEYDGDSIDVKGTMRVMDKGWDYTNGFLVLQK